MKKTIFILLTASLVLFTSISLSHATWYTFADSPCKVVVYARQSYAEDVNISFWTSGTWWRDASQPILHAQYDKSNGTATCPAGMAHNRFRARYAYQFNDMTGVDGISLGGSYINWMSAWPGLIAPDGDIAVSWEYFDFVNQGALKQVILDYCQNPPSPDPQLEPEKNMGIPQCENQL